MPNLFACFAKAIDAAEGTDKDPNAALVKAATRGDVAAVERLVQSGADVNYAAYGGEGFTPLTAAAARGHLEVANVLIKAGADVNKPLKDGSTPLGKAVTVQNAKMVQLLVNSGAKLDLPTRKDGSTPLHVAAHVGAVEMIQVLKDAGASLDVKDDKGKTPYDWAVMHKKAQAQKLLKPKAIVEAF